MKTIPIMLCVPRPYATAHLFSPVGKKNMGGKHGNADMLWAFNALKQQLFCIIHSYMRDNPSLGKMSQICRSDVSLKNILCYE